MKDITVMNIDTLKKSGCVEITTGGETKKIEIPDIRDRILLIEAAKKLDTAREEIARILGKYDSAAGKEMED